MPSHLPLPRVSELVRDFHDGIRGQRLTTEDRHDGSVYDLLAGPSAILFSQQAQRDRDLFRQVYNDVADGQDLTDRVFALTGVARYLDSYGTGTALLARPTAALGAGTIWPGSRILMQGGGGGASFYAVQPDPVTGLAISVGASQLTVAVPVRATTYGPGVAINSTSGTVNDPLWDNTWTVQSLQCGDGTLFEKARAYVARARQTQANNRVGFQSAIAAACQAAGATSVAVFSSGYAGSDYGVSAIYVSDAGYSGSQGLVNACAVALESWRVLGPDALIGAMVQSQMSLVATVALSVDPATADTATILMSCQNAAAREFAASSNGFAYSRSAIGGAMTKANPLVQSVTITTPSADASVMAPGPPPTFPKTLTRYSLAPQNVLITIVPPS